jgi:hypothetical protein
MSMIVQASKPSRQAARWVVWMLVGAIVVGAVGALGIQFAGGRGQSAESVRVELFGATIYRTTGPFGTMDTVILWWSLGVLAVFALVGATLGALVAWAIGKLSKGGDKRAEPRGCS